MPCGLAIGCACDVTKAARTKKEMIFHSIFGRDGYFVFLAHVYVRDPTVLDHFPGD